MRGGRQITALLTLAAAVALALAAVSFGAGALPVLAGPWAPHQRGYGHVKPATIYNGGDPTGLVTHIHWSSWGAARAHGSGTAEYVGPNQSVAQGSQERAQIVAFKLGTCHGRRAYNAIGWYFPEHGERFNPRHYIDACNGNYYE